MIRHTRSIAVVATVTAAACFTAGPASAQTAAEPGAPATFAYHVDGFAAPVSGRVPTVLQMSVPTGSKIDLKALPKVCALQNQAKGDCDDKSRFAKGTLTYDLQNTTTGVFTEQKAYVNLFRSVNNGIVGYALLEYTPPAPTTAATTGTDTTSSSEPKPVPFQGSYSTANGLTLSVIMPTTVVSSLSGPVRLKAIDMEVGATTTQRVRNGKTRSGKTRYRKVRRYLVRLPQTCPATGSWTAPLTMTFADSSSVLAPNAVSCSAG